ncbi:MAG: c-type cytochrome [Burkholderiaceae bacterium]
MTRQSRARWLAFATAVLVVLLAAVFAWLRNLTPAPHLLPESAGTSRIDQRTEAGRAAFMRAGCIACHSAEGRGNPSLPLDGVGARLDRERLRAAAFATGNVGTGLPAGVASAKRAHANDPDVDALLAYLQSLR